MWVELYSIFVHLGHLPQFKETVELSILTHRFDWLEKDTLTFASNEVFCKPKGNCSVNYNCFGYRGHFHILEKLGGSLGRVSSAIWGEWVSGLCHCDQGPLGTQLGVETHSLRVAFGPKIDCPNAIINIRWVRLLRQQ